MSAEVGVRTSATIRVKAESKADEVLGKLSDGDASGEQFSMSGFEDMMAEYVEFHRKIDRVDRIHASDGVVTYEVTFRSIGEG